MNVLGTIIEGFKKVFKGENAFAKHLCLFAITGFISVATVYIQNVSEAMKATQQLPNLTQYMTGIIILLIVSLYLSGYNLIFAHNSFKDNIDEYLPEINLQPIFTLIKAIPILLCWGFYIFLTCVIGVALCTTHSTPLVIIGIGILLVTLVLYGFVQFVTSAAYPQNFDTEGLFNISLPLKYAKFAFGELVLLGLLYIIVGIVAMIPSGLAGFMIGVFGNLGDNTTATYVGGILGGYCGCITQLVWYYCIVQIYREKIEPNMY